MFELIFKLVKGKKYLVDKRISKDYLFLLMLRKGLMAFWGLLSCIKHKGFLFLSPSTKIIMRRNIVCGRNVQIGSRCYLDALSLEGIVLGDGTSIGRNCSIECTGSLQNIGLGFRTGRNVGLGMNCFYGSAGGIIILDDTIIGNFVSFHSENHNYSDKTILIREQGVNHKGIKIGKNCWIGARAVILDGAIVGDGCVIAAGAVVTSGFYKENGVYSGVPAKFLKDR